MTSDGPQAAMAAWATELDIAAQLLAASHTTVIRHGAAFAGQRVAFALATPRACVVTVPADWYAAARAALARLRPGEAFDTQRLAAVFGPAAERVVGPAWQAHLDTASFTPADPRGTRLLTPTDRAALATLASAGHHLDWQHSAIDPDRPPLFGCFAAGTLVAAGTLSPWRARFWSVGIITHPDHRRRGYGRAVVSAMSRHGLERGWLLRYQTLLANAPSVALARSLGYQEHALTIAVRLTPPDPHHR
jgi:GNAT superfamily N-acetyltransferase